MMSDKNMHKTGAAPDAQSEQEVLPPSHQEEAQLRQRIAALLKQVEDLREAKKNKGVLEDLVVKLREANQHLVIATVGAQDKQASAEAAGRRQEEFLTMLAHELRNPLAPIAMAAELLGKVTSAHPQLPKIHRIICRQVSHMTHLVDDLLDASRFGSGKITLQRRALRLSEIIESAVETSQPVIDTRNQQLQITLPAKPVVIDGDLSRLAQVFSNLLINAAKFSPEYQSISVSASTLADCVTVSVKDHGMGIPAAIQPFIFDLFTQGFQSLDRSQGGLGIGLALVRIIVEMHGGSVAVHSEGTGLGSEFIVRLPISRKPLPAASVADASTVPAHRRRILIIEDNADANETLQDLLSQEGHSVRVSFDGPGGLAMAMENVYDVIICDIGLPGMDGYEVIKQLRRHTLRPVPCFIAVTGYNQPDHGRQAGEIGFDHYLVKPVASEVLFSLISASALN